ncbi:MAG: hypothetical protein QXW72_08395 [Conexivisphaerales archaeon]
MIGMYYGDPHAEGVVGTRPKDVTHWAYQYESVVVSKLTLAVTPIGNWESRAFELGIKFNHCCWLLFGRCNQLLAVAWPEVRDEDAQCRHH